MISFKTPAQVVTLPKLVENMHNLMQIRLTNVPAGFSTVATLSTNLGDRIFTRSQVSSTDSMVVLGFLKYEIFAVKPFQNLIFAPPLPPGTKVEIFDPDQLGSITTVTVPQP